MKVYLAGPINGCDDDEANGWRQGVMDRHPDIDFLDPMRRDYRGREDECVDEIISGDMNDIAVSDVFLAYAWQPSWGTAMEIYIAWASCRQKVIVVVPAGQRVSPWLRGHSDYVVTSLAEAEKLLVQPSVGVEV